MKKLILGLFCAVALIIPMTISASAQTLELEYTGSGGYSADKQGDNNWYYMVKKDDVYYNMEYDSAADMQKWRYPALASGNYVKAGKMHPGSGNVITARVWEAPYGGAVTLSPSGNVAKVGVGGDGITLRIYKNKTQLLWEKFLEGTDTTGYTYTVKCEVLAGDRIYFEIDGGTSDHYGETQWDPIIKYTQAAGFAVNGQNVTSVEALNGGDTVECTFYDGESIVKGDALLYLVMYDDMGRMREITAPITVNLDNSTSRIATSSIKTGNETSFEKWKISLHVLTSETGRYYRNKVSTLLNLE